MRPRHLASAVLVLAIAGILFLAVQEGRARAKAEIESSRLSAQAASSEEKLWLIEATVAERDKLSRALEDVGSVPYANPGMNCYDHSKLLQRELAKAGIESSIVINADRSHAWVAVWVEANTGRFVPPDNRYGPVIEMRDERLDVICHR